MKYFYKLHARVILKILPTQKLNALKIIGGISFINTLGESIQKVFDQFSGSCRITLHKILHKTLALESFKRECNVT